MKAEPVQPIAPDAIALERPESTTHLSDSSAIMVRRKIPSRTAFAAFLHGFVTGYCR
jgi:hypothetical protein